MTAPTSGPQAFMIVKMPVDIVRYSGLNQRDEMVVPDASAQGPGNAWKTADSYHITYTEYIEDVYSNAITLKMQPIKIYNALWIVDYLNDMLSVTYELIYTYNKKPILPIFNNYD
eukprot:Mrub_03289.p3 GENE.Mrub_03289~~Mrub_03289.p3  ORF type:complete len:115 (+),score=10.02 Mrub_03289:861-1205(+)